MQLYLTQFQRDLSDDLGLPGIGSNAFQKSLLIHTVYWPFPELASTHAFGLASTQALDCQYCSFQFCLQRRVPNSLEPGLETITVEEIIYRSSSDEIDVLRRLTTGLALR